MYRSLTFLLTMWLIAGCTFQSRHTFLESTCFTNVSIIDAVGGQQDSMTVVVMDGKIAEVAKSSELLLAKGNNIVDCAGKFMIPGLWDAHVHFAYIEELAPAMFDLFLTYGVTSVRDTGGKLDFVKEWKDKSLEDPTSAPRVMIAGPLLDGMPNVYDGSTPSRPPLSVGAGSVEEAEKIVEDLAAQGVDLIKAYEMLTPEQFVAITALAKQKGLKVTGHIPLSMDAISAANAGMNSIEHMRNIEMSCARDAQELLEVRRKMLAIGADEEGGPLRASIHAAQRTNAVRNQDPANREEVLDALKRNDTWQIPTLSIMTAISKRPFARAEWIEGFKYLPDEIGDGWRSRSAGVVEGPITEANMDYEAWALDMVHRFDKKGIPIMAGTDCPIFFLTPGQSLHEELALLVEAGLAPLDAIAAATLRPAEYFDIEDRLGLIKEDYEADLLLLDANPLEDIANTLSINTVIKAGKIYDRAALDQKLRLLEEQ